MRNLIVIFLGLALSSACWGIYDTVNNIVSNGDAESDFTNWYYSANASIAADSAGSGTKSFQLNPASGVHSDIRTAILSAQEGDKYLFSYSFKSLTGAYIGTDTSYAMVRSYDGSDLFIGQDIFPLELTNNQWQTFTHEVTAKPGAAGIDVTFNLNGFSAQDSSGQFRVDEIKLYRKIPSLSEQIGAMPTHLYVVRKSALNDAQFVMIQSLQGLLAQNRPEIWIDQGDTSLLNDLIANHGVSYSRIDSFYWYINRYRSNADGYILFDFDDKPSLTAANALAGIMNAVVVEDSLKSYMDSNGYSQVFDARGHDDQWVYNNYWNQFNQDAIVVRTDDISFHPGAYYFRDWGVAIKSLFWWNDSESLSRQVYDSVRGNAPCYGWTDGTTGSELESIAFHSESGLFQVPADWMLNLSTLAGMAKRPQSWQFTQPISDNTYTKEQGVHYVAFKLSDMDNILTIIAANNFSTNPNYYANPNRGNFAMGWGMPPSLVELAPSAIEYWYRSATENDGFSAPTSGLGYTYPHLWPQNELEANMLKLGDLMAKADLKTVVISDNLWPQPLNDQTYGPVAEKFASIDRVKGMFYIDVNGDYARYGREADAGRAQRIYWFNDKPLVPCRYTLWDQSQYSGISQNGVQLANSINALPTDPQNPASYTFVIVHAWSYGLNEVANCIANLDPDVRVVTPDELIAQVRMNFLPCDDNPPLADLTGDCDVNTEDLKLFYEDWLQLNPQNADFNNDNDVDQEDFSILADSWLEPN